MDDQSASDQAMPSAPEDDPTEPVQAVRTPANQEDFDPLRSLLRLAVGGAIEGTDTLFQRLRDWETNAPAALEGRLANDRATNSDLARYVLVGFLFVASDTTRRALVDAARLSLAVGSFWSGAFSPILNSRPARPLRRGLGALTDRTAQTLGRWARLGRQEETRGRAMTHDLFGSTVDDVVTFLGSSRAIHALVIDQVQQILPELAEEPALEALVQEVAGNYLAFIQENPAVLESLVKQIGDGYIAYLDENPEGVQQLIQGQSLDMTTELLTEVRSRGVTGDSLIETILRNLLRRTPRADLPPPPPQVQARALRARLASDFEVRDE